MTVDTVGYLLDFINVHHYPIACQKPFKQPKSLLLREVDDFTDSYRSKSNLYVVAVKANPVRTRVELFNGESMF